MKIFPQIFVFALVAVFLAPVFALLNEGVQSLVSEKASLSSDLLSRYGLTSLLLLVGSVSGAVLFGTSAAYLCARCNFRGRRLIQWLSILPLGVPSYLVAYTWVDFLVDQGVPGGALRNLPTTCFVFAVCLSPYVFLPSYSAFSTLSGSVLESAKLLGKSQFEIFRLIEFPLVRASLFAGGILAGMEVLADFGTVDFMAIDTWSTGIYRSWFGYGDRGRASLLAVVLFLISGALLFWETSVRSKNSLARSGRSVSLHTRKKIPFLKSLPFIFFALIPALVSCVFPALILTQRVYSKPDPEQWASIVSPALTTLGMASVSSIIVVVLGLAMVLIWRSNPGKFVRSLARIGALGYALPGGVLGLGLLILLAPFSLSGSVFGLLLAYCIRFATIGTSTLEAAWLAIPRVYDEQARLLGCTQWGVFRRVTLPLLRNSIACAFILTCIDIIKELPATMLLRPFNFETLAIRTYNLASDERLSETAPSSLAMIALCMTGVFVAEKLGAFGVSERSRSGK